LSNNFSSEFATAISYEQFGGMSFRLVQTDTQEDIKANNFFNAWRKRIFLYIEQVTYKEQQPSSALSIPSAAVSSLKREKITPATGGL
jgi:predicted XRE-type DNA-binding protein